MSGIELIICVKMDLALNDLQRLICHKTQPTNQQFDGEVPGMLVFLGMQSTPSSPSLPDPLLLGVVAPDKVQSMSQIELNCVLMLN